MFSFLGLLTGLAGPMAAIANKLADLYLAKQKAKTDDERMKIDQQIEEAHDRRAMLVAEASQRVASTINASMRAAISLSVAVILAKLLIWDKTMGSFAGCAGKWGEGRPECAMYITDALDPNQWLVIAAVVACYTGYDIYARSRR